MERDTLGCASITGRASAFDFLAWKLGPTTLLQDSRAAMPKEWSSRNGFFGLAGLNAPAQNGFVSGFGLKSRREKQRIPYC
jgi:hypothetical protein